MKPTLLKFLFLTLISLVFINCSAEAPPKENASAPEEKKPESSESTETGGPFLWKIEGEKPSYLFGTIHLPDDRVLDLPAAVEKAFSKSGVVVTEIELDMSTQSSMMLKMMDGTGKPLSERLPEDVYKMADAYLEERGLGIEMFNGFKVWAVMMNLQLIDYMKELMTKVPMDMQLYMDALEEGKEVDALETLDEQIGVFESFNQEEQVQMLKESIEQMLMYETQGIDPMEMLLEAYLSGDEMKLLKVMEEEMGDDSPTTKKFFELLIDERNKRMAERIDKRISDSPGKTWFFAVGAAHYPGETGILKLLREKGYTVERIGTAAEVPAGETDPAEEMESAEAS